ncbi:type II toxin-antitoxin system HicA family toxin, partial [Escherichia sp. MOD1-EC6153]|uniref:type II toxin-antitoxin system HicA family toxin n=1 Tax=Escherichia sp. MOD1-EC6153 TaxID=2093891 RepID=UPI00301509FE
DKSHKETCEVFSKQPPRTLAQCGRGAVTKAPGGGSHQKVSLNGKRSVFPDHGSKEMPEPLRKKIMRDLGL